VIYPVKFRSGIMKEEERIERAVLVCDPA